MAISYAPFGDDGDFRPKPYVPPPAYPKGTSADTTECNYVIMGLVGAILIMGLMDSLRGGNRPLA